MVHDVSPPHRLPHAEPDTDREVEEDGAAEQERGGQPVGEQRGDRPPVLDRGAEVAPRKPAGKVANCDPIGWSSPKRARRAWSGPPTAVGPRRAVREGRRAPAA